MKTQISVSFTTELVREIDNLRGTQPRSAFIRELLEKVLK